MTIGDQDATVRWGILSTARIATKVAAAIAATPNTEVTVVASRTKQRAQFWARQQGIARSHHNYEALVDDPEVDAVYIPLPPSLHAEWTIRMIDRFCQLVRSGQLDEQWPNISVANQRVCDALNASARSGEVVEIDA